MGCFDVIAVPINQSFNQKLAWSYQIAIFSGLRAAAQTAAEM